MSTKKDTVSIRPEDEVLLKQVPRRQRIAAAREPSLPEKTCLIFLNQGIGSDTFSVQERCISAAQSWAEPNQGEICCFGFAPWRRQINHPWCLRSVNPCF